MYQYRSFAFRELVTIHVDKKYRYIIVRNGAAGLAQIASRDPQYYRLQIYTVVGGKSGMYCHVVAVVHTALHEARE